MTACAFASPCQPLPPVRSPFSASHYQLRVPIRGQLLVVDGFLRRVVATVLSLRLRFCVNYFPSAFAVRVIIFLPRPLRAWLFPLRVGCARDYFHSTYAVRVTNFLPRLPHT